MSDGVDDRLRLLDDVTLGVAVAERDELLDGLLVALELDVSDGVELLDDELDSVTLLDALPLALPDDDEDPDTVDDPV